MTEQLFHPGDERTVWTNIISGRLHHHHEVTRTVNAEHELGFAFSVLANSVECVYGRRSCSVQRNADADGAGQLRLRFFQGDKLIDSDFWIGPLLDAHAAMHQHGNFLLEYSSVRVEEGANPKIA